MLDDPMLRKFLEVNSNHRTDRPVAVFDCDGTVIKGDIGEAMLYHQIEHFWLKTSPARVWPDHPEAHELDRLYGALAEMPPPSRRNHSLYEPFARLILDWYFGQIAEGQVEKACSDIVRLFSGYSQEEVRALAQETFLSERGTPLSVRTLGGYSRPRGIRYIDETVELLKILQDASFDLWVVSGSNRWSVESVFTPLGIPPERIIGIELAHREGLLIDSVIQPVPVRENKISALKKKESRIPLLVASDSRNDIPLFQYSAGLKVYVNSRRKESTEFFAGTPLSRDDSWVIIERPTLKE